MSVVNQQTLGYVEKRYFIGLCQQLDFGPKSGSRQNEHGGSFRIPPCSEIWFYNPYAIALKFGEMAASNCCIGCSKRSVPFRFTVT